MEDPQRIIDKVKFDEKGLVPAITQDINTKEVLMVGYMNRESLKLTMETGFCIYWSRSRGKLWKKGEQSRTGKQHRCTNQPGNHARQPTARTNTVTKRG